MRARAERTRVADDSQLGGKAAHSPRFSIGGSADLKPLNALLSTEKNVLTTTAKLSNETKRAGDALRDYGANEGDDLRDVLGKVALLFDQLSRAQLVFTEHEETYRAHFKSVRAREEAYAQLRKTNDSLAGKIDSAERTLAKTSQEHKEREVRERKLYELRQEKIGLENAVAKVRRSDLDPADVGRKMQNSTITSARSRGWR